MPVPGISAVRVANMALSHTGSDNVIESLTEDSVEAKQCKLWYDFARQMTLRGHNWSFARKRQALSEHSQEPPDDWSNRYQYPADCLVMRQLVNPAGPDADNVPFSVQVDDTGEAMCILTNLEEAVGEYTFDLTKASLFSPHFILAMSYNLASLINPALTGDKDLTAGLLNLGQAMTINGGAADENQEEKRPPREGGSVRARQ